MCNDVIGKKGQSLMMHLLACSTVMILNYCFWFNLLAYSRSSSLFKVK